MLDYRNAAQRPQSNPDSPSEGLCGGGGVVSLHCPLGDMRVSSHLLSVNEVDF